MPVRQIEKRLRIAGVLVGLGLAVQFVPILWNHPLAFLVFVIVGVPLTVAGTLTYLVSLLIDAGKTPST